MPQIFQDRTLEIAPTRTSKATVLQFRWLHRGARGDLVPYLDSVTCEQ